MSEKITVVALGHRALGTTLPEQKIATKKAAKAVADLVEAGNRVVISHSNGPQVQMYSQDVFCQIHSWLCGSFQPVDRYCGK